MRNVAGCPAVSDEERIALREEAESLPVHVQMCALRHRAILQKIEAADTRGRRIERIAWAILGVLGSTGVATVTQLLPIIGALAQAAQ